VEDAQLRLALEGQWPYLWIDATYVKVRRNNRVVSVAAPPGRSRPGTPGRSAT
jgi:hypothetical protein